MKAKDTYDLYNGIGALISSIKKLLLGGEGPVVVAIAGGSGSGKTSSVAAGIKSVFKDAAVLISLDDYYKTSRDDEGLKKTNFDEPAAIDLELAAKQVSALKSLASVDRPVYNPKSRKREGTVRVEPKEVIVIEGLFTLTEPVLDTADIKVFIESSIHSRLIRNILRDSERTGYSPAAMLKYRLSVAEPMHARHVAPTAVNADFIIRNEYDPIIESLRTPYRERQMKLRAPFQSDLERLITEVGGKRTYRAVQTDHYLNPPDRILLESDEMLRVRDDGHGMTLTYKGPKYARSKALRARIEFGIDGDIERLLHKIYTGQTITITKERSVYTLNGATFALDKNVRRFCGKKKEQLGTFVELSSGEGEEHEKDLALLKNLLGIYDEEKRSYTEIVPR